MTFAPEITFHRIPSRLSTAESGGKDHAPQVNTVDFVQWPDSNGLHTPEDPSSGLPLNPV